MGLAGMTGSALSPRQVKKKRSHCVQVKQENPSIRDRTR
jgi:hypothetical protein